MSNEALEHIRALDNALSVEIQRLHEVRSALQSLALVDPADEGSSGLLLKSLYNIQVHAFNSEAIRQNSKKMFSFYPEASARLSGERWGRVLRSYRTYFRVWWRSFSGTLRRK